MAIVMSPSRILIVLGLSALICSPFQVRAEEIQKLSSSPENRYFAQRRTSGENKDGTKQQYIDFLDSANKKILFSICSPLWRSTDVSWSPNGQLVCINDRIATSGDFMYLLRVNNGIFTLLRIPHDALFNRLLEIYEQQPGGGRITINGSKWLSNNALRVIVSGGGYQDDKSYSIIINYDEKIGFYPNENSVKSIKANEAED